VSDESYELEFVDPPKVAALPMVENVRLRVSDYFERSRPAIR
jgi:hypothetical protein